MYCVKNVAWYLCLIFMLSWSCTYGTDTQDSRDAPALEDNMYAQLLIRAVSGSLCQAHTCDKTTSSQELLATGQPYDSEAQRQGRAEDHTRIQNRRKQLESIYEALRVTWEEEIRGDFVEVGDWRGEASIFAACVIKQLKFGRDVWVLGR